MLTTEQRTELLTLLNDALRVDPTSSFEEQRDDILSIVQVFLTVSEELEKRFELEHTNLSELSVDLEHLIVFSRTAETKQLDLGKFIDATKLPKDLKGLTTDQYLSKLENVLTIRRYTKDWSNIFRVIKERTTTIRNFIQNMDNRMYELRYKHDGASSNPEEVAKVKAPDIHTMGLNKMVGNNSTNNQPKISQHPIPHTSYPRNGGSGSTIKTTM